MAAPKGNTFWKIRSKHGRDKLFASPDLLLEAATEYFEWCDANPWYKSEAIKSGDSVGKIIKVPISRPYTISGLCIYLQASESYWRTFKIQESSKDFLAVIEQIEETCKTQKFEGAAVGAFNANIIARDLGLTDKVEQRSMNYNYNSAELTPEEIRKISKTLDDEF